MEISELKTMVQEIVEHHRLNSNHANKIMESIISEMVCREEHRQLDVLADNAGNPEIEAIMTEAIKRTSVVRFEIVKERQYAVIDKDKALVTVKRMKGGRRVIGWNGFLPSISERRKELEKQLDDLKRGRNAYGYKSVKKNKEPLTVEEMKKEMAKIAEKLKALKEEPAFRNNIPQDMRYAVYELVAQQAKLEGHTSGDSGEDENNDE